MRGRTLVGKTRESANHRAPQWHVWRIDRHLFGIQNLGKDGANRVDVVSDPNVIIVMGHVPKQFVAPMEWFEFAVLPEYQSDCHSITVEWLNGRSKCSQVIDIRHAVSQRPMPYPMPVAPNPLNKSVYPPPLHSSRPVM